MRVLSLLGPGFLAGECREFTLGVDQEHVLGLYAAGVLPHPNGVFEISFTAMEILRQVEPSTEPGTVAVPVLCRVGHAINACVLGVRHEVGVFPEGEPEILGLSWLIEKAREGEKSHMDRQRAHEEAPPGGHAPRGLLYHLAFAARAWFYEQEHGR